MVSTSLFTGLAGLKAHQTFIDVIGSNLANVSTPGYRGSRVTFSDLLSFTLNPGSGPSGNLGGTNPKQIGLGAAVASIDLDTRQGTFQDTGRSMDLALQGKGFFTSTDGVQNFYSRVGAFGVDDSRLLVDLRTGFRILGSGGGNISIPVSDTLPASQTNSVTFTGSLPATVSGPLEEIVQSSSAFLAGQSANQTTSPPGGGTTYDLTGLVPGSLLVRINNSSQQQVNFNPSDFVDISAATTSEIETLFSGISSDLTVTSSAPGQLSFDTVKLGGTATLKFDDSPSSTGLLASLGLNTTQTSGSEGPALLTTDLSGMTIKQTAYVPGDQIRVQGTNPDGSPFSATFIYGAGNDGTTVGDLVNFTNGLIPSAEAAVTLNSSGNLVFTAANKQPANMSLSIGDITNSSNPAKNNWPSFTLIQDGTGPDTALASIDVVDSLGRTHPVEFTFTRSSTDSSVWDLSATVDPSDGTIGTASVSSIRFNQDGSFNVVGGGNSAFNFNFNGLTSTQSVNVNLGTAGLFDGVTMLGAATTVAATDQDGFGSGTLLNLAFTATGDLTGFYSNGQSRVLDTLRISVFPNEGGLLRSGNTLFTESPNSDNPITTTAGSSIAGTIRSGSLENSNVDIAEEFVKLIEAQRGFQANSRVITTTDQILAELVNIVR